MSSTGKGIKKSITRSEAIDVYARVGGMATKDLRARETVSNLGYEGPKCCVLD
jgi:hypothetical protein